MVASMDPRVKDGHVMSCTVYIAAGGGQAKLSANSAERGESAESATGINYKPLPSSMACTYGQAVVEPILGPRGAGYGGRLDRLCPVSVGQKRKKSRGDPY